MSENKHPLRRSGQRLRWLVWAAGALACLGWYAVKAVRLPRRTEVGVEREVFRRGFTTLRLMESPSGGKWIVAGDDARLQTSPSGWLELAQWQAERLRWPASRPLPRRLAPFRPTGTWRLDNDGLRRAWRYPAEGWLNDHSLWGGSEWTELRAVDLRRGRTQRGPGLVPDELLGRVDDDDWGSGPASVPRPTALESVPPDFGANGRRFQVGSRTVEIVYDDWAREKTRAIYAVSDHPAARVLRLTGPGEPLALSADGRTLFFNRQNTVWRLDFHRPLPELLDAATPPALPIPEELLGPAG